MEFLLKKNSIPKYASKTGGIERVNDSRLFDYVLEHIRKNFRERKQYGKL